MPVFIARAMKMAAAPQEERFRAALARHHNLMFFVERNTNSNVVAYFFDSKNGVTAKWIMYEKDAGGAVMEDLLTSEKWIFGVVPKAEDKSRIRFHLAALPRWKLSVGMMGGAQHVAILRDSGERSIAVRRIRVELSQGGLLLSGGLIPRVQQLDVYGLDLQSQTQVHVQLPPPDSPSSIPAL
jgi:hypothetical protein